MLKIITKIFEDKPIYFEKINGEVFLNATKTAKQFPTNKGNSKDLSEWLNSKSTKDYIKALQKYETEIFGNGDFIIVRKGGNPKEQGTWIHSKLTIHFARWLSSEFAVWCDLTIEEILQTGSYSLQKVESPKPEISISETLSKSVEILHLIQLLKEQKTFDLFLLDGILENESPTKLLKIDFSQKYFLPTELGFLKGMSGAEMNLELEKKGFQIRENEKWILTEKGREFGIEIGGKFSQLKWKLEAIN
jgi:predicted transcriptional regulator